MYHNKTMMHCIIIPILSLLLLVAAAPVAEAFVLVSKSPHYYYAAAVRRQRQVSTSSSLALAGTTPPQDTTTIQAWAASAALMTVMSFSQIASATVQPTTEMTLNQYHPSSAVLVAAGAYQPEAGFATLDLGFPKYNVDDGPAAKGPQGETSFRIGNKEKDVDLSSLDPKQAAKLEAKRQAAAQRAKMEQEKQMVKMQALAAKQQAKEVALEMKLAACESGNLDNLDLSPNEKSKLIKKCNAAAVRKQKEDAKLNSEYS